MKYKMLIASLLLLGSSPVFSSKEIIIDVDNFLRTVDLTKIIYTNNAVNLVAQLSDPTASTVNIDEMTDFFAMGSKDKGLINTWLVEFNNQSEALAQKNYRLPWIGVGKFIQSEIPKVKLQDGLQLVKSCIATKMLRPAPEKIHRVVIFKAIQTNQMVYDYVFVTPRLPAGQCQEILYTPDTGDCQMGIVVACHTSVDIH